MPDSIKVAEKINAFTVDGKFYRVASDADVAAGYPHGNVAAVVGKRVCILVPLAPPAA